MSIRKKLILCFLLFSLIPLLVLGIYNISSTRNNIKNTFKEQLRGKSLSFISQIESSHRQSANSLLFLSQTLTLKSLLDAYDMDDPDEIEYWTDGLNNLYKSFINKSNVGQHLRFVNVEGRELVHIAKKADGAIVEPIAEGLDFQQHQGFQKVKSLAVGTVLLNSTFQQSGEEAGPSDPNIQYLTPVYTEYDDFAGCLIYDINVRAFSEFILKEGAVLLDKESLIALSYDHAPGWDPSSDYFEKSFWTRILSEESGFIPEMKGHSIYFQSFAPDKLDDGKLWTILIQEDAHLVYKYINRFQITFLIILLVIGGITYFFARIVGNSLGNPIVQLEQMAILLSGGDLSMNKENLDNIASRKDELGDMGRAFRSLKGYVEDKVEAAYQIAHGNLSVEVRAVSDRDQLGLSLAKMVERLRSILTIMKDHAIDISKSAHSLGTASNQLIHCSEDMNESTGKVYKHAKNSSGKINQMASAAESISMEAQSISNATTELSNSMRLANDSIQDMLDASQVITTKTTDGDSIIESATKRAQHANESMHKLDNASKDIFQMTDLIKKIADSTNLLALNASIEAASAGQAGKGFSVVAEEIKDLAKKSKKAIEQIQHKMDAVQVLVQETLVANTDIASIMQKVKEQSGQIRYETQRQNNKTHSIYDVIKQASSDLSDVAATITNLAMNTNQIQSDTKETADTASRISRNIQLVSESSGENNAIAEQVTDASRQLTTVSTELLEIVREFKIIENDNLDQ